ncbi:MAG: ATP-binding protein [Elusimicrobiales bacterium]
MTTKTEKKERRKKMEDFFRLFWLPLALSVIGSSFLDMALAAFGVPGSSARFGHDLSGLKLGYSTGLMFLLVYLWGRPAFKYADRPDEKLRDQMRGRIANMYRDAFIMLAAVQAVSLALLAIGPGRLTWAELTAVALSLLAQAALLVVYIDSGLAKQRGLMELLYSPEELVRAKGGFTIPVYIKVSMLVVAFAIVPFVLVWTASYNQVPWKILSGRLLMMLLMSGIALLHGVNNIYTGIQIPLDGLIARMRRVSSGDYSKTRIFFSDEVARLKAGFNEMVDGLREREEKLDGALRKNAALESELAVARATADLAAQVAHDIRSPLASLAAAARGLEMPDEQRVLVQTSVARMQGIADDLLRRYRAPDPALPARGPCLLAAAIEAVMGEKRLQYSGRKGLSLSFVAGFDAEADIAAGELQRVVSNLVNNSVEALAGGGSVEVALRRAGEKAEIEVRDDGPGMPPELLEKLGTKGFTSGKAGGTGLGLYHARAAAEAWGGSLEITSSPGTGTVVRLALPARPAAARRNPARAALLDDDLLVHMNWRLAARSAGVELLSFKKPEELLAAAPGLAGDTPLYIDSDLGAGGRGEDVAAALKELGFSDITMATGHAPGRFAALPWLKVAGKEPPFTPAGR